MLDDNIVNATHWWLAERDGRVVTHPTRRLVKFLFQLLDALHANLTQFPAVWPSRHPAGGRTGGTGSLTIFLPLTPGELALLRAALAIVGDAYAVLQRLSKIGLESLQSPIANLTDSATRFRQLRNFFAHLDERLSDFRTHGIRGPATTTWGLEYTATARDCMHLVMYDQNLHFTQRGQMHSVEISRGAFVNVLAAAMPVYNELMSHTVHPKAYDNLAVFWPLMQDMAT